MTSLSLTFVMIDRILNFGLEHSQLEFASILGLLVKAQRQMGNVLGGAVAILNRIYL
jgi:hypothetical protein